MVGRMGGGGGRGEGGNNHKNLVLFYSTFEVHPSRK